MKHRTLAMAAGMAWILAAAASGQLPPPGGAGVASKATAAKSPPASSATQQATIETSPIDLVYPDRYAMPVVLEPNRRLFVMASSDGIVRGVTVPVGATVRESQEIVQLDRSEATARQKIAEASVKEAEAELAANAANAVLKARLEAARAHAELSQIELDRCTLRAPFPGRLVSASVAPGQYIGKGTTIAELSDVSTLKVLVPVDRTTVGVGANLDLVVEGKTVSGKIQSVVPLPEAYATLRELATPWAAAWIYIDNAKNAWEPGQRARGPFAITAPVATIPSRAMKTSPTGGAVVQVVRSNAVLELPVRVIGDAGFDRTQVSGAFLPNDTAVVESSIPLVAGTVIRFSGEAAVSGAADGNRPGTVMDVTLPPGAQARSGPGTGRVAPIGAPGGAAGKAAPTTKSPATKSSGTAPGTPPF